MVLQYFADVRKDFKDLTKVLIGVVIASLIINLIVVGLFLTVIRRNQSEFMDFLNMTDFEVIIETNIISENESFNENNTVGVDN